MRSWPNLRHYPAILLKGLRKSSKNLVRIAGMRTRILNSGPPEYKVDFRATVCEAVSQMEVTQGLVLALSNIQIFFETFGFVTVLSESQ
jgi:hypothetical protein